MRNRRTVRAARAGLFAGLVLAMASASADELTARQIVERVHAAAGGQAWLAAGTNVMRGHATLCRDGDPARCVESDRYEMCRVYPTKLEHGAHAGSGKFRLDAYAVDKVLFKVSFDGERSYDQNGPVPPERASSDEASAFGFSAIRFALQPGFTVERMVPAGERQCARGHRRPGGGGPGRGGLCQRGLCLSQGHCGAGIRRGPSTSLSKG